MEPDGSKPMVPLPFLWRVAYAPDLAATQVLRRRGFSGGDRHPPKYFLLRAHELRGVTLLARSHDL
jgi:hypothetical protein